MHFSTITALSAAALVSGAALKRQHLEDASNSIPSTQLLPALPLEEFAKTAGHMLTLEEALAGLNITDKMHEIGDKLGDGLKDGLNGLEGLFHPEEADTANTASTNEGESKVSTMSVNAAAATCSTVRVRTEWDSTSTAERQNFVDSLKCLMAKPPSGQFSASKSRYEDFTALHQTLTPRVHSNSKFLLWHRYLLWTWEQELREQCGLTGTLPWFDETKYAGKFGQSSIFSSQWFGGIGLGGACVTDGVSKPIFHCTMSWKTDIRCSNSPTSPLTLVLVQATSLTASPATVTLLRPSTPVSRWLMLATRARLSPIWLAALRVVLTPGATTALVLSCKMSTPHLPTL